MTAIRERIRDQVVLPIATPLITGRPSPRVPKLHQPAEAPRRSTRLASKVCVGNPTVQAQNILMVKMGLADRVADLDAEAAQRYEATFMTPLSHSKHEAFCVLFNDALGLLDLSTGIEEVLPTP